MKEIDTEATVVWPAWCYSGSGNTTTSKLTTHSPLTSTSSVSSSSSETTDKPRNRRKSNFTVKQIPSSAAEEAINPLTDKEANTPPRLSLTDLFEKKFAPPFADNMLSDRMMLGFNATSAAPAMDTNRKHCDSNSMNFVYFDKMQTDSEAAETAKEEKANNNNNSLISNNLNSSNNNSSNSGRNNNCVKRERLSPAGNGEGPNATGLPRSRSATPSSFRGTPPQNIPIADAGFLATIKARSNDFATRNYSDLMRSLASKYNNSNPNDSINSTQRPIFKPATPGKTPPSKKEPPPASSPDSKGQNPPITAPNVSPFVTTLLSSLPFSRTVFPPLIDMSSTQALMTLARAAKEAELQAALAQKRPASSLSISPSPHTSNLAAALQQATHFASPALLYSSQFHQPHTQSTRTRTSTPPAESVAHTAEKTATASPLDLSSAPNAKRIKLDPEELRASLKSPEVSTCQSQSDEVQAWTVDDVCGFVATIDICEEYVQNFREQRIDGSGLPLLTEDHLTNQLGMKLGPALKLRSVLMKKLGGPCPCVSCATQAQILAAQTVAAAAAASSSPSAGIPCTKIDRTSVANNTFSTNVNNSNCSRPASADSGS